MRFVTYQHPAHGLAFRAGLLVGDIILDCAGLLRDLPGDPDPVVPGSAQDAAREPAMTMLDVLDLGPAGLHELSSALSAFQRRYHESTSVPAQVAAPLWNAALAAPLPSRQRESMAKS